MTMAGGGKSRGNAIQNFARGPIKAIRIAMPTTATPGTLRSRRMAAQGERERHATVSHSEFATALHGPRGLSRGPRDG
jgi:hypothetical protein